MTSTSGTFINEKCICKGDNSGPRSAKSLLADKRVDCAVLETARGGIICGGLGYDLADVGVITNISEDHLGIDGINDLEDLAFVKSLVVEAVKSDGYAVLNADDGMTPEILERVKAKTVFFSRNENAAGIEVTGIHVFVKDENIVIKDGDTLHTIINIKDIPITCNGIIECNIENSLTTVSALYALKIPDSIISEGLKSFNQNKGRFNLYSVNDFKVMLDYGHNKAGYEQVIKTCKNLGFSRLIGVIGMPGDRNDDSIKAVSELCANSFDAIIIKEDKDRRGREEGEVAKLFYHTLLQNNFNKMQIILNEEEALKAAVNLAEKDDLIVVLYEELDPLVNYLNSIGSEDLTLKKAGVSL